MAAASEPAASHDVGSPHRPSDDAGRAPAARPAAASPWRIEVRLAAAGVAVVAALAGPVIGVAALVAGRPGAIGAAIAAGIVLGMFVLSGAFLAVAAPFGPGALLVAALGGFAFRLFLYAVLMAVLTPLEGVSGHSLAVSAAVLLVAALVYEARLVCRVPSFSWLVLPERTRA